MASRRLMGMTYSLYGPASRFRFKQFIPFFERAGWQVIHRPNRPNRHWRSRLPSRLLRAVHNRFGLMAMAGNRWLDLGEAARCDVIFLNRDLGPGREFLRRELFQRNPRVIYDYDDAIFLGRDADNVRWMCEKAAWVTPGNEYLAEFARQFTDRVSVVPTVVDTHSYRPRTACRQRGPRVGWSGSDQSIHHTLMHYLPMLARIQQEVDFELVVITNSRPSITEPDLRWTFLPWDEEAEVSGLQTLDIGLMPLKDDEFQRGKCGLKLLQYMAVGIPTIASPVGVNQEITQHGKTGFLASTEADWRGAMMTLARDRELCETMGAAGRQRCVERYSIDRWGPVLLDLFERVSAGCRDRVVAQSEY
jgi:glycosyltransferase involved in cell wall biosynthesis